MNKLNKKKGFTLAELLVVVAIIAVLVAISIPIFTSQLEKARESTDAANIRAAYAEVMTAALTDEGETTKTVDLTQTKADWQSEITLPKDLKATGTPSEKGKATVTYDKAKDEVTVTYAAGN